MFTRKTAAPNPAMTVDVSVEGVLVKLGAKPVYFDRKRRQMLLKHPDDMGVERGDLVGPKVDRASAFSCFSPVKGGFEARDAVHGVGHVVAKRVLKRPGLVLAAAVLLFLIGHAAKPIRRGGAA